MLGPALELLPRDDDLRPILGQVPLFSGDADLRLLLAREPPLGLLAEVFQTGDQQRRFHLDALEEISLAFRNPDRQCRGEILAAQEPSPDEAQDLDHPFEHLDDRHVERSPTQIEHHDALFLLRLVKAVGDRRGGRFVENSQHVQPGDAARLNRGLPLMLVEIRGHRDDGLLDRLAQVCFASCLSDCKTRLDSFSGVKR